MVRARSAAEIPVLTPREASIETVKAVWYWEVLSWTIKGRSSCRSRSSVRDKQIRPRPCVAMKLMASGVTFPAAITRSPSFSRSSSSVRITIFPLRISARAFSTSPMLSSGFRREGMGVLRFRDKARPAQGLLKGAQIRGFAKAVKAGHVLANHVGFQVDPRAHRLSSQGGAPLGLRNEGHRESMGAKLVYRQADPVHCDRALLDEQGCELWGEGEIDHHRPALGTAGEDFSHCISVPSDQVPSKA